MTKKKHILALACAISAATLLLTTSCDDVIIENTTTELTATGNLEVDCAFDQEITEFSTTRSGEEATRATTATLSDTITHIYYVVMKDGTKYKEVSQKKGVTDFGKLNLPLEPGTYQLATFANNETSAVTISDDGLVGINDNRLTESYSYIEDITISLNERTTVKAKLSRCVSRLNIKSKDKYPDGIASMKIVYSNAATKYDLVNNAGCSSGTMSRNITIEKVSTVTDNGYFSIYSYLFVMGDAASINATISFYDASNTLLYTREMKNISLKKNRNTNVSLSLFTSSGTDVPSITFNYDWLEDYDQSF
jgi:hypothetical protein